MLTRHLVDFLRWLVFCLIKNEENGISCYFLCLKGMYFPYYLIAHSNRFINEHSACNILNDPLYMPKVYFSMRY
jgi:hypothetical protein